MHNYTSRKFVIFTLAILVVLFGWVYSLLYKADQLATISTLLVTLLGTYSGANLTDTHLANKLTISQSPPPQPAAPPKEDQDNG